MKNKIQKARKVMRDAFKKDSDFENVYIANMACLLHDQNTRDLSWRECNDLAQNLLVLIYRK